MCRKAIKHGINKVFFICNSKVNIWPKSCKTVLEPLATFYERWNSAKNVNSNCKWITVWNFFHHPMQTGRSGLVLIKQTFVPRLPHSATFIKARWPYATAIASRQLLLFPWLQECDPWTHLDVQLSQLILELLGVCCDCYGSNLCKEITERSSVINKAKGGRPHQLNNWKHFCFWNSSL